MCAQLRMHANMAVTVFYSRILMLFLLIGIILPDDNDPNVVPFPLVYWNAAAAAYAYLFGQLAGQRVSWVGMSQLVGCVTQFPSVSMVNWTTGMERKWCGARKRTRICLCASLKYNTFCV